MTPNTVRTPRAGVLARLRGGTSGSVTPAHRHLASLGLLAALGTLCCATNAIGAASADGGPMPEALADGSAGIELAVAAAGAALAGAGPITDVTATAPTADEGAVDGALVVGRRVAKAARTPIAHVAPTAVVTATRGAAADATTETRRADRRRRFLAAREALAKGDRARFLELEESLVDYPLRDFLVHEGLRDRWRRETPTRAEIGVIEAFAEASADRVLTRRLVRTLQARFAETERWEDFLALRESPLGSAMPCRTLRAREATAPPTRFDEGALALWIDPPRRNAACLEALDALEARALAAGALPISALWERIYTAMEANRPEVAEAVLDLLARPERRAVAGWIGALDRPVQHLAAGALDADTLLNRRIIADLVLRWSREDTRAAMRYWRGARERFSFSDERRYDTDRALAMRAAYRRMPEAGEWLNGFEARADDLELMEWRVRVALLAGDWGAVLGAIERLPPAEREEDHWAYWEARALEAGGLDAEARAIDERLATLQSWHGFLSAERIGVPHSIEEVPIRPERALLERLATDPALVRALEFDRVGLAAESRREWNGWLAGRGAEELAAAAVLAADWGLGDRAIFSAGRAERRQALSLRFPLLHAETLEAAAGEHDLDLAWVHGLVRRESAYIPDIRSPAGAIGLMQLMPATARDVARWSGRERVGDLTDPATNAAFGTYYLRRVLDRFDGHAVLATASYNAGPHRVAKWLPEKGAMEADRWIDTIPFTETRRYVRAVLAYAAIYRSRLGEEPLVLADWLAPVRPSGAEQRTGRGT